MADRMAKGRQARGEGAGRPRKTLRLSGERQDEDRATVQTYLASGRWATCAPHVVVTCPRCGEVAEFSEIDFMLCCPRCGRSLLSGTVDHVLPCDALALYAYPLDAGDR